MKEKIVRYSWDEWMADTTPSRTDWERIKNMTDDDIDFSDIPEPTDEQLATARHVKYCDNEIDYDKMPFKEAESLNKQHVA